MFPWFPQVSVYSQTKMGFGAGVSFLFWKPPPGTLGCWGSLGFQKQHLWRAEGRASDVEFPLVLELCVHLGSSVTLGMLFKLCESPPPHMQSGEDGNSERIK